MKQAEPVTAGIIKLTSQLQQNKKLIFINDFKSRKVDHRGLICLQLLSHPPLTLLLLSIRHEAHLIPRSRLADYIIIIITIIIRASTV